MNNIAVPSGGTVNTHLKVLDVDGKVSALDWLKFTDETDAKHSGNDSFTFFSGTYDRPCNQLSCWNVSVHYPEDYLQQDVPDTDIFLAKITAVLDGLPDVLCVKAVGQKSVLFGCSDGTVNTCRWDEDTGASHMNTSKLHALAPGRMGTVSIDYSHVRSKFVSAGSDGTIHCGSMARTDLPVSSSLNKPFFHGILPTNVRFMGTSTIVLSTNSSKILILDQNSLDQVSLLELRPSLRRESVKHLAINSIDVQADGNAGLVLGGDNDGNIRLWDLRYPSNSLKTLATHEAAVSAVRFHPSLPNHVLSAATDGTVILQDMFATDSQNIFSSHEESLGLRWSLPPFYAPSVINALDLRNSLAVAGLDNASILLWKMA